MATSSITLSGADILDLATLVASSCGYAGSSSHRELDDLLIRFELPEEAGAGRGTSYSIKNRSVTLLRYLNGDPKLLQLLNYLVGRVSDRYTLDQRDEFRRILGAYGFEVDFNKDIPIYPTYMGISEPEQQEMKSWLEENTPEEVLTRLNDAIREIGSGNFEDALQDCRMALEALTTTGTFSNSLSELVSKGVVQDGSSQRRRDNEILKAIYGYNSTLGSHTSLGRDPRARAATRSPARHPQSSTFWMATGSSTWPRVSWSTTPALPGYLR